MARVNVTIPDDLIFAARAAGLNVSRVASEAIADTLERLEKIAAVDAYLAHLDAELGPVPACEQAAADAWVETFLAPERRSA